MGHVADLRGGREPGRRHGYTKDHGFVFGFDPADPSRSSADPITGMGRFAHEAVCIDPRSGTAYLTEDASGPLGLTYRYEPVDTTPAAGALHHGGELTAMACTDGGTHVPTWPPTPSPAPPCRCRGSRSPIRWPRVTSTRAQLSDDQVTRSRKFEGTWWGNGRAYIVCSFSTVAGLPAHSGQVWSYDPLTET